jgi:hypothetical protein
VEREGPSVGKDGECDAKSWHLQGCSPCLHRLRNDELAPVSKYWTYWPHTGVMGPVSLVAGCQQRINFPHCFIGCCGREAGYEPIDRLAIVLWIGSRALLLRGSGSVQHYWWLRERLLYMDYVRYVQSRAIHRPSVESMWHVGRVFLCRVYIDWIAATLRYEYRLFVVVITYIT